MRKLLFWALLIIIVSPVVRAGWPLVSDEVSRMIGRVILPLRAARLYAAEPDKRLLIPLKDIEARQVADTWGAARSGGRRHEGQDLFAPRGTEIYSATEGYVLRIGENRLGGNTVSVLGAGGRIYYYAHLNAYAPGLTVGDRVTPATLLGYVGTTGNARGTPPHLHFGIYTLSGAINPLPLLVDRGSEARMKNHPEKRTSVRRR